MELCVGPTWGLPLMAGGTGRATTGHRSPGTLPLAGGVATTPAARPQALAGGVGPWHTGPSPLAGEWPGGLVDWRTGWPQPLHFRGCGKVAKTVLPCHKSHRANDLIRRSTLPTA